jgi:hypothetical protein
MVINSADPEYRGRVQVFIPHIMPTLYEGWNKDGKDIDISCVGSNIPDGLDPIVHARLCQILPWAEAASPIIGSSAPGNLFSDVAQGVVNAANAAVGAVQSLFVQTPTAGPFTPSGVSGEDLANTAKSMVGVSTVDIPGTRGGNVGCAAAVSLVFNKATGQDIIPGQTIVLSTSQLYQHMSNSKDWVVVPANQAQPGDIIVTSSNSSTGANGHTGFIQENNVITSNSSSGFTGTVTDPSARGTLQNNYTLNSWNEKITPRNAAQTGIFRYVGLTSTSTNFPKPSTGAEQGSSSGLQAAPNELAKADAATATTAPAPQTTISAGGQGISGTISGGGTVSTTTASPGMKAALAAIAQGESGFSVKEANTNFYNALAGPGRNANVVREYNINGGNLADAQAKYGDYGFFQANDATEGQTVYNYLKSQGKDETTAQYYRDAITNSKGTGNFSLQDQTQAAVYLFAGDRKLAGTKAALDQLDPNDPNFKQKAANLIMQHKNKWFGIDEGVAAGATDPNSSSFAKINGTELVNAQNIVAAGISSSVVNNTDGNGRTPVINTNDMANGLFAYPNPGAMVWVFFREGNPLFPVYFAASYSSAEWKSAYRGGSPAVGQDYDKSGIRGTGSVMKLGPEGGILSQNRTNINDPLDSGSSLSLFHGEGSNITFKNGCDFHYSKNNKRDEVEGDKFVITRGYKEQWVEGDDSLNVRGNVIVKVGKFDQEALDAMKFISDFSNELNQTLMQNSKA